MGGSTVNDSDIPLTLTSVQQSHSAVEGAEAPVQRSEQQPDDQHCLHSLIQIVERFRYNILPEDPPGNLLQSPCPPAILRRVTQELTEQRFGAPMSRTDFYRKHPRSVELNKSDNTASNTKHRKKELEYTNKNKLRKQSRR